VREYPETQNAVVTVSTAYFGLILIWFRLYHDAVGKFHCPKTARLHDFAAPGASTITANLRLKYDPNKALTEITTKVNVVLN
jgi:multidrug efflux pump